MNAPSGNLLVGCHCLESVVQCSIGISKGMLDNKMCKNMLIHASRG